MVSKNDDRKPLPEDEPIVQEALDSEPSSELPTDDLVSLHAMSGYSDNTTVCVMCIISN